MTHKRRIVMRAVFVVAVFAVIVAAVSADTTTGSVTFGEVAGVLRLPNGQSFKAIPQLHTLSAAVVTLHSAGVTQRTLAKPDGSFVFQKVPVGLYMMTVEFGHLVFPLLRVSVLETRAGTLRVRALVNDATQASVVGEGSVDSPLEIVSLGRHGFFIPREEYSILSLFKNPMVIMMVVSVGMMGLMKLVPQDELRQQMKEMNKQVQDSKQQLGLEKKSQ